MSILLAGGFVLLFLAGFYYIFKPRPEPEPRLVLVPVDRERQKCTKPVERWLYDSLKMRGFVIKTKVPCGPYQIDLALPSHKIAIHCKPVTTAQKIWDKQQNRYLKRQGWRVIDIRPHRIYSDFNEKLRKIDVYMHN